MSDQWKEEVDMLIAEFQWTINFFKDKGDAWHNRSVSSPSKDLRGAACYASRQATIYGRLQEQCTVAWKNCYPVPDRLATK